MRISAGASITKGMIFDIKKYATDDGPGIRTTVFFKGCPLRCWWCHNPEGQTPTPELMYRRQKCNRCGECAKVCPRGAITHVTKQISINRKGCNLCGECSQKCPTNALTIIGKETNVEEVMKEIDKDMVFYEESNGGMTVSGGEPLTQIDFLNVLLEKCKERNIHTAVDTCGYAPKEAFHKVSDKVDLFLFDIKLMDSKKHMKYTSVSNKLILENFTRLAENGNDLLVRFPIIPKINDDEDNVTKTAEFILSHGIGNLSLLPYHRAGIEKYKSLGKAYKMKETVSPSDEKMRAIKERFEALGLRVRIGGG
jgi:pyruvate formate lyase activating enzyme